MARSDLEVAIRRQDGTVILDLIGDVDATAETALQRAYDAAAADARAVVLNFSRTDYINSTGIALIVRLLADARTREIEIAACGLSEHYRKIFEITRLSDFMRITDA